MDSSKHVFSESMLLRFSGENIRSFRTSFNISLEATNFADQRVVRQIPWRKGGRLKQVLPAAGIFGANGSGKSNVLKAMGDMRMFILFSFRLGQPGGGMPRRPFLLERSSQLNPSTFAIELILNNVKHEYGFTIDSTRVIHEWAFHFPNGRKRLLFERRDQELDFAEGGQVAGRQVAQLLRPNALFLSTAASANYKQLLTLFGWFEQNLILAEEQTRPIRQTMTAELLDDPTRREMVLDLLRAADLGITGTHRQPIDPMTHDRISRALRILNGLEGELDGAAEYPQVIEHGVQLKHQGSEEDIPLAVADESIGTLIWFGLVGPVVDALAKGLVFLADELDASLHPMLVHEIVRLFQDPITNPNGAQLIFNSHDSTLLGDSSEDNLLGRDQVWFTEKSYDGGSRLYPLIDLDPRKNEAIGKRYLARRYGGTPILSRQDFDRLAELLQ